MLYTFKVKKHFHHNLLGQILLHVHEWSLLLDISWIFAGVSNLCKTFSVASQLFSRPLKQRPLAIQSLARMLTIHLSVSSDVFSCTMPASKLCLSAWRDILSLLELRYKGLKSMLKLARWNSSILNDVIEKGRSIVVSKFQGFSLIFWPWLKP